MTRDELLAAWKTLQDLRNRLEIHGHSLVQIARIAAEEPDTRDGWPQALVVMSHVARDAEALAQRVETTVSGWIAERDAHEAQIATADEIARCMARSFEPEEETTPKPTYLGTVRRWDDPPPFPPAQETTP